MEFKNLSTLASHIKDARHIVITTHRHPDGDAIGSSLGLYHVLKKITDRVDVIVPDNYPSFLKWMTGSDIIHIHEHQQNTADELIKSAELIFSLDYNQLHRTQAMEKALNQAKAPKVLVDHHPGPKVSEFDFIYSEEHFSSTAEIVYKLLIALELDTYLDKDAATALYAGILTDTGSFSYSIGRPEVFETAGQLVRLGVEPEMVSQQIYDTYSESRLRLLGYCLSQRMKVFPEYATAYIYLTREDMERFNYQDGDAEGLVNYGLSIKGINLSVLLKEKDDVVRMSLRSKEGFAVNTFAREHFEGGGHQKAAGANSYMSMQDTIKKLEALLPQYKEQLNRINR